MKLNIGGGKGFKHQGWINLDAAEGFDLSPQCKFPLADHSVGLVYSSHCLEHLNDATVDRVLSEARRVMAPDGSMAIVLPDFEDVLRAYKLDLKEYFNYWWLDGVAWTWSRKGIEDNIASRASMIFCGWWNKGWGDHFISKQRVDPSTAYHGPAPIRGKELKGLLDHSAPHDIAMALSSAVLENETDFAFNHQNAWSRQEFEALLGKHGFQTFSTNGAALAALYDEIPGLMDKANISMFFGAVPA